MNNPYIAGKAVGQERGFFGRTDILRLVERNLRLPEQNALVRLLECYLDGTGITFSAPARTHILRATGGHPFLVQIAAAALFDVHADGVATWEDWVDRMLQQRAAAHFDDIWRRLSAEAQRTLLTLARTEREADIADPQASGCICPGSAMVGRRRVERFNRTDR